jgi:hypothetical protein
MGSANNFFIKEIMIKSKKTGTVAISIKKQGSISSRV